jgi:hypothetical protein
LWKPEGGAMPIITIDIDSDLVEAVKKATVAMLR